jgi:hypothetical protein
VANVCASYRLDFASGAWHQLGAIEREAFRQLTRELREIATRAPVESLPPRQGAALGARLPGGGRRWAEVDRSPAREQVTVGRYAAIYEVDHAAGAVLVIDVIRVGSRLAR